MSGMDYIYLSILELDRNLMYFVENLSFSFPGQCFFVLGRVGEAVIDRRLAVMLHILIWLCLLVRLMGDTAFNTVGITCPRAGHILYQQQATRTSSEYEPAFWR